MQVIELYTITDETIATKQKQYTSKEFGKLNKGRSCNYRPSNEGKKEQLLTVNDTGVNVAKNAENFNLQLQQTNHGLTTFLSIKNFTHQKYYKVMIGVCKLSTRKMVRTTKANFN